MRIVKIIAAAVAALIISVSLFASGKSEVKGAVDNHVQLRQTSHEEGVYQKTETQTAPLSNAAGYAVIERDMNQLERLYKYVEKNYLYEVNHEKIYDAMATALFESLDDTFSYYIKPEDSEEYEEQAFGKYGGLGIYFSKQFLEYQNPDDPETLYCVVTQVFKNTPASRAGLVAGDMITHIDGESVEQMSSTDCAKKIKGEIGSSVKITVMRSGSSFDVELTRALITVPTVEYTMMDDETGYILILEFSQSTSSKIKEALADLMSLGMKSLIIDLRNNPGGDVDETLRIADMFISDKTLLTVSYKDSSKNKVYISGSSVFVPPEVKIAILVNGGSASSSEIFASTMRDNGRATLVGEKTFGKGIMQMITSFGEGYTSLTIASFVPPSGNPIHKTGVIPDIEIASVSAEKEEMEEYSNLLKSGRIKDFVNANPEYSSGIAEKFMSENSDVTIRPELMRIALRNEYTSRMKNPPIYDLELDSQLAGAYSFIKKGN